MPQTINTNLVSLNAQRNLNTSQSSLAVSMQRLSSGLRVNSAKDDAAGLAIAERMSTQVRGLSVAARNANDAISMAQVGEGALGSVANLLQRMRELSVQAANGTNNSTDRDSLNNEFVQLAQEATRTLSGTQFNSLKVLASTQSATFQIGANGATDIDQITVDSFDWTGKTGITGVLGSALLTGTGVPAMQISAMTAAQSTILGIDKALDEINAQRATFGAIQNRFENVIANAQVAIENQSAARARIMDADYAVETSNLSRAQILQQAGSAMVAQANQLPQMVLSLLKG
ncbi:MAG TPA: flagellin [Rubrivivax sp.]|nr:flagellin [Rubrivivax sp.]